MANRSFAPGHFALVLDGAQAGWLHNVQGGGAVAAVIANKAGADAIVRKSLGPVRYEDIVLSFGSGMAKAFYDWVTQASRMEIMRRSGAVVVYDASSKELSRMEFYDALISEISFPAVGGTSKDPCSMTVKLSPETVKNKAGDGSKASAAGQARTAWVGTSFRLEIDGLEDACKRVSDIEPITIAWNKVTDKGGPRGYSIELGTGNPGNLNITLQESSAQKLYDWFESFVIQGNNGADQEKTGKLVYLSPNLVTTLFTLEFQGLGIFKLTQPSATEAAKVRKIKAELYCESIRFEAAAGA